MEPAEHPLRAPAGHRAAAALACPVVGYFVARLVLHWTNLPAALTYAGCLLIALVLAWRAWSTRLVIGADALQIVNTLATTSVARSEVRRITDTGRVVSVSRGSRAVRLPVEALHQPWWAPGAGRDYELNRNRVRGWLRSPSVDRGATGGFVPDVPAN